MKTLKGLNTELKTAQTSLASAKSQVIKYQAKVDDVLKQIDDLIPKPVPTPTPPVVVPTPTPTPTPVVITPVSTVKPFRLDLSKGLDSYKHIVGVGTSANVISPECITIVDDAIKGKVMRFDVKRTDTGGVTENPRAQCQTPMQYVDGDNMFIGFSVKWDTFFWTYFQTISEVYGAPYAATSPFRIAVQQSNIICAHDNDGKEIHFHEEPLVTGKWYDFVYREKLSQDKGEVQVWLRRQGESDYTEIVPTTSIPTITKANITGPNYHKIACYYDKEHTFTNSSKTTQVDKITMYFANHNIGSTFNEVKV